MVCAAEYAGLKTLQPAVQYLAGDLAVEAGQVLPLQCAHNTVRMKWDVEAAEYLNLAASDAAFPVRHFSMVADRRRTQVRQPLLQTTAAPCRQAFAWRPTNELEIEESVWHDLNSNIKSQAGPATNTVVLGRAHKLS